MFISAIPWTVAHQVPLSMEFSRQEYWSGLPFPSPGDLPNPEMKPASPALLADFLTLSHLGNPIYIIWFRHISLEGMMLKLKLRYFGHLMWRVDSLEKTLMLGGIEGRRRRGRERLRWLDGITDSVHMSLGEPGSWWWTGGALSTAIHGVAKSWTRLSNWTELNWTDLQNILQASNRNNSFKQHFSVLPCPAQYTKAHSDLQDQH